MNCAGTPEKIFINVTLRNVSKGTAASASGSKLGRNAFAVASGMTCTPGTYQGTAFMTITAPVNYSPRTAYAEAASVTYTTGCAASRTSP